MKLTILIIMKLQKTYYVLVVIAVVLLFLQWISIMYFVESDYTPTEELGTMKYILLWTPPYELLVLHFREGQTEFLSRKCKINECFVTSNRSFFNNVEDFDVVAIIGPEIKRYKSLSRAGPATRSPHQKYVYLSDESSQNYPICDRWYDDYFNWTWTYRLDSDGPYGYITIRNSKGDIIGPNKTMHWIETDLMKPIDDVLKKRLNAKKKAAAWFVSSCKSVSKRYVFAKNLQKKLNRYGLEIDIYGKCGTKKCHKSKMHECWKMVETDYYFYLSLENSFDEDYVTEKLLWPLQHYAVPVVLGGANYTRFMPDGIYLHGGQLTPTQLAKEMNDIIKDKERYYSFFKWRNHYSYHAREEAPDSDDHCRMCEMLHDEALVKKNTVYTHFRDWWNGVGKCSSHREMGNVVLLFIIAAIRTLIL